MSTCKYLQNPAQITFNWKNLIPYKNTIAFLMHLMYFQTTFYIAIFKSSLKYHLSITGTEQSFKTQNFEVKAIKIAYLKLTCAFWNAKSIHISHIKWFCLEIKLFIFFTAFTPPVVLISCININACFLLPKLRREKVCGIGTSPPPIMKVVLKLG